MSNELKIPLSCESIDEGTAEETTTFILLSMTANDGLPTVVEDVERTLVVEAAASTPTMLRPACSVVSNAKRVL